MKPFISLQATFASCRVQTPKESNADSRYTNVFSHVFNDMFTLGLPLESSVGVFEGNTIDKRIDSSQAPESNNVDVQEVALDDSEEGLRYLLTNLYEEQDE